MKMFNQRFQELFDNFFTSHLLFRFGNKLAKRSNPCHIRISSLFQFFFIISIHKFDIFFMSSRTVVLETNIAEVYHYYFRQELNQYHHSLLLNTCKYIFTKEKS